MLSGKRFECFPGFRRTPGAKLKQIRLNVRLLEDNSRWLGFSWKYLSHRGVGMVGVGPRVIRFHEKKRSRLNMKSRMLRDRRSTEHGVTYIFITNI